MHVQMDFPVRFCLLHCAPPTIRWRAPTTPTGGVMEQDEGRTNKTHLPTPLRMRNLFLPRFFRLPFKKLPQRGQI